MNNTKFDTSDHCDYLYYMGLHETLAIMHFDRIQWIYGFGKLGI